jgi:type VII secretion integral membrane protein EccD
MVAFSRVTVVGSRRRIDVSLPASVPVAELLADLVHMLDERSDGVPARWTLAKVGGRALDLEQSLADQGVTSGAMLFLQDATAAPPPPAVDDFADQVAVVVDASAGHWTAEMFRSVLIWFGGAGLFVAGAELLVAGDRGTQTVAGILGAALAALAGVALVRLAGRRDLAGAISMGSLSLWAAAGVGVAAVATADATGILAAALGAVTAGALVALLISGDAVLVVTSGVMAASLMPAVVLGGCELVGARTTDGAAIICPLGLAAIALSAPIATRVSGLLTAAGPALGVSIAKGRRLDAALLSGFAVMLAGGTAVLAIAGGWYAWGLVAATAVGAATRARHYRFAAEVVPLLAAALAAATSLELGLLAHAGLAAAVAALIADGLIVAAIAGVVSGWTLPAEIARRLRSVEWIALAASVPLALGVLGAYDAAMRFARGFS